MTRSLSAMMHEIQSSARMLMRRPVFSMLTVALFAIGIGAVAAIYCVVYATMLRPLPYRAPDELLALTSTEPAGDSVTPMLLGYVQLSRWRSDTRVFSALEGYTPSTMKFLGGDRPEPVEGALISAGFFDALGWQPARGRAFTRDDETPQSGVVMISHALWQRRFAGDPNIVGTAINIDEMPRTIIGVMPKAFSMPLVHADAWLPVPLDAQTQARKARLLFAVGRLKNGFTAQQAYDDLTGITKALGAERPDEYRYTGVRVTPMREALFGAQRTTLLVLLVAGVLLLAVAIVNVISLALSDAIARRTATMTRIAFGADRFHILRLRLFDVAILGLVGSVIGLVAAQLSLKTLYRMAPDIFGRGEVDISVGWTVVVAAVALGIVASLLAALPAAVKEAGLDVVSLAGSDTKSVGGVAERRGRSGLLVAQVGLAVVLLVGAALLSRNVRDLLSRPTGFRTDNVSVVELTFSPTTYKTTPERARHAGALIDAIKSIPGVSSAATIQTRFVLNEMMNTLFEVENQPVPVGAQRFVNIRHVTAKTAEVLGIRLLRGRFFTDEDREGTMPVALVSAAFARTYFPNEDPIGRRVRRIVTQQAPWMEIVGIVDDIKDAGAGVPVGPILFVSYSQQNTVMARPTIVVRSQLSPSTLFPALRKAIWSVDGNQTIDAINRLEDLMLRSAAQPRFAALVAGLLSFAALILLLSGIYSATLYSVLRRTREIGVRAALGAGPRDILWSTIRQSVVPVLGGAVVGLIASVPAVYWMRGILSKSVSVEDAPVFVAVLGAIVLSSVLAALVPARRALRIAPAIAMRDAG